MRSSTMLQTISWETPYKIHRSRKITEQEFDGHKREIAQLYVNEDLELDEVRRIMAQKFKFYGSEPQYKKHLRQWKLEKNLSKREVIQLIKKSDKQTKCIYNNAHLKLRRIRSTECMGRISLSPVVSIVECRKSSDSAPAMTNVPSAATTETSSTRSAAVQVSAETKSVLDSAVSFLESSRYAQALECLDSVMAQLGNTDASPAMADATGNYGLAFLAQGEYAKAREHTERALAAFEKTGNHRHAAGASNNLGVLHDRQGDYQAALEAHKRALAGFQQHAANTDLAADPDMVNTLNNMGIVYRKQGDTVKALEHHIRALAGSRKLGDHQGCATTLNNIGVVFFTQGNFNSAWEFYNRSLSYYENNIFGENADMMATYHNIGLLFESNKYYANALPYYQRALAGYTKLYGDNSHATIGTLRNLGNVCYNLGNFEKCVEICSREFAARKKVLGKKHCETVAAQERMEEAKAAVGRVEKAKAAAL
ncbi:Similar to Kinesin light chain; acc. no. P46822 [Pyronema omphalodes CBS 100304]|uniref:Similar to Kinesin light chain acc. no. P46822 n=1 Tax=Pyronema omphalodes (strain CBS 100304) TaxID=1076935 RepID=U4LCN0_PYROM|nr:Similar to Kinesin light chain; acc. no. P46822 [Pyronema omphalodes CBS 100304]